MMPEKKRARSPNGGKQSSTTTSHSASPPRRSRYGRHSQSPPKKNKRHRNSGPTEPNSSLNKQIVDTQRFVAMDCECVGCGVNGRSSALARVVLIDFDGNKLMDEFVGQTEEVTDYRTFVSGITEEDLTSENVISFEDCRRKVLELIQGKVLVGHALKNDLNALKIAHPWYDTRDTGKYEPFMKVRFDDGILWPRKLRDLAKSKLKRDIQIIGKPHCPIEDAMAAMDLYKLVWVKWEKTMDYKVKKTREIERLQLRQ